MRHPPSGGSRRRRTGPGWAVNRCFSAVCCGGEDSAGQIRPARKLTGQSAVLSRCDRCRGGCCRRWRVTWAASWAREAMSSLANTYTRWVCTVRRQMYCPLADLRVGQPCRRPSWRRPAQPGSGWPSRTAFPARTPRGTRAGRARDARPARRHTGGPQIQCRRGPSVAVRESRRCAPTVRMAGCRPLYVRAGGQVTFRPVPARTAYSAKGLSAWTPASSKSFTLRVTTAMPCTRAVAAMSASITGMGCVYC